jgi:menaquinone-dependent protoporphyrinogen oxidase
MVNVLIAYASTHGHTAKICRRIADVLQSADLDVDLCDLVAGDDPDPRDHDGVIVAASIHKGAHQPEVVQWAKAHLANLGDGPNAFVSVSLTAAEDTDESRAVTRSLIDDFVTQTGWTPDRSINLAGALQYREYDFFTRTLMRLLMRRGGHPTDTSHDYDYTDWDTVAEFAKDFHGLVSASAVHETAGT